MNNKRIIKRFTQLLVWAVTVTLVFTAVPLRAVADAPTAVDDYYEAVEGSLPDTLGNVLDNDGAGSGVTVAEVRYTNFLSMVTVETVPAAGRKITTLLWGIVWIYPDGSFIYAPPVVNNSGPDPVIDSFEYRLIDDGGQTGNWATAYITLIDTVPVAIDDSYTLTFAEVTSGYFGNVMVNDTLSKDFISREGVNGATATVQNIVWMVRSADGATEYVVPTGAYNPAGDATVRTANGGEIWISQNGDFKFLAPPSFVGNDTFQYILKDADGSSEWATVTFAVPRDPNAPIKPPIINDEYTVQEGSRSIGLGNVLDNDGAGPGATVGKVVWNGIEYDVPAAGYKFTSVLGGIVTIFRDGGFNYTAPTVDNNGPDPVIDSFQYRVKDADGNLSDPGTVFITLTDTVPVAVDDFYTLTAAEVTAGYFGNVMDNDTLSRDWISRVGTNGATEDVQNIVWMARSADGATEYVVPAGAYDPTGNATARTANGGEVWINQNGSFKYLAPPYFVGNDTFQYLLKDADGSSEWATVTFTVPAGPINPPDPSPPVVDDNYTAVEGSTSAILGNVLDNDGAGLGAVVGKVLDGVVEYDVPAAGYELTTELGGAVTIFPDGTFSYTAPLINSISPDPVVDHFQYRVMDGDGNLSELGTVNITITSADTNPGGGSNPGDSGGSETGSSSGMPKTGDTLGLAYSWIATMLLLLGTASLVIRRRICQQARQ